MAIHQSEPQGVTPAPPHSALPAKLSHLEPFANRVGGTPVEDGSKTDYKVSEHILWAPRKMRVASIGAGASGIMFCYKKEKEFGDSIDLVVYERYPSCGGVWYANRYPGARCDVPSAAYQFSFAPRTDWPRYYSPADEIQKYYGDYAEAKGYTEKYIKLRHEVVKAVWDNSQGQWVLTVCQTTESGEKRTFEDRVDFLIGNIGVLNTWRWPDIPNREAFRGQMTHSAEYDESLDLKDKRVAVIGSGASSIQIVPAIRPVVSHLISFYRTPQWIGPGLAIDGLTSPMGDNFNYTPSDIRKFQEDPEYHLWYRKALEDKINSSFPTMIRDHPFQKFGRKMVAESMAKRLGNKPELISRMVPDFPMGCRRLGPAEGFLECFLEDNVTLAEGDITTFTEKGIKTSAGQEYEVDIIICATGFDVSFKPYFPIIGVDGVSLAEAWKDEPAAYFAMAAHGFPNFLIGSLGPNCPAGHGSFVTVLEAAQNYVCKAIRKMQTDNIKSLNVKADAVREYNTHVHEWLKRTVWAGGCRSWYNQGKADGKITAQYPGSLVHWIKVLEEPRFEDYEIKYRSNNRFEFMGNGFTETEITGADLSWYLQPEHIAKPLFRY